MKPEDRQEIIEALASAENSGAVLQQKRTAHEKLAGQLRDIGVKEALAADADGDPEEVGRAAAQLRNAAEIVRRRIETADAEVSTALAHFHQCGYMLAGRCRRIFVAHCQELHGARVKELSDFILKWRPADTYAKLFGDVCNDSLDWKPFVELKGELQALDGISRENFSQTDTAISLAKRVLKLLPNAAPVAPPAPIKKAA